MIYAAERLKVAPEWPGGIMNIERDNDAFQARIEERRNTKQARVVFGIIVVAVFFFMYIANGIH